MRSIAVFALMFGCVALSPAADEPAGTKLFNGNDLTGFRTELSDKKADPQSVFQVKDGVIVVSGKTPGYFVTDKSYSKYTLSYEWKYPRPTSLMKDEEFKGNSGCLIHIQPPAQVWPKCVEVQGMNRDAGNTFGVGTRFAGKLNKDARNKALKPVGEWNQTEVICSMVVDPQGKKRGKIITKLNGVEVCTGDGDLTEGAIGWQSEGAEIHYRNITIREEK